MASLLAAITKLQACLGRLQPKTHFFFFVPFLLMFSEFAPWRCLQLLAAAPPHIAAELGLVRATRPVEIGLVNEFFSALPAHFQFLVFSVSLLFLVKAFECFVLLGQRLSLGSDFLEEPLQPVFLLCRLCLVTVQMPLQR